MQEYQEYKSKKTKKFLDFFKKVFKNKVKEEEQEKPVNPKNEEEQFLFREKQEQIEEAKKEKALEFKRFLNSDSYSELYENFLMENVIENLLSLIHANTKDVNNVFVKLGSLKNSVNEMLNLQKLKYYKEPVGTNGARNKQFTEYHNDISRKHKLPNPRLNRK